MNIQNSKYDESRFFLIKTIASIGRRYIQSLKYLWGCGVVVITTVELHSTKPVNHSPKPILHHHLLHFERFSKTFMVLRELAPVKFFNGKFHSIRFIGELIIGGFPCGKFPHGKLHLVFFSVIFN